MSWKDKLARVKFDERELIGASFRGAPFFVASAERSGGRRTVVDEFPFRDTENVEDLGRRANTFRVDGYVVGDDYLDDKDALLAALQDKAGAGELVHPYYGRRQAICTEVTTREAVSDGGVARFSIQFRDAPPQTAPVEEVDFVAKVDADANAAIAASNAEFVGRSDVDGQPSFALASLSEELTNVLEGLEKAVEKALSGVVSHTQELAKLAVEIDLLVAQATALVHRPHDVAMAFMDVLEKLKDMASKLKDMASAPLEMIFEAFMDAYATPSVDLALGTTSTRAQERANQSALAGALRQFLVIEAARLLPLVQFESIEAALIDLDLVVDALDDQAATATDVAYPGLVTLRSSVTRAVPGDTVLARIQTIERRVETPSLLLAYQLYGTVDQEADIIARNRIRHPGFIAGSLQVLSNV